VDPRDMAFPNVKPWKKPIKWRAQCDLGCDEMGTYNGLGISRAGVFGRRRLQLLIRPCKS